MGNEGVMNKELKVEISGGGLARQGSMTKHNCLCSPTTHVGSFRCRLHRSPSLHRTKSIESAETKTTADCVTKQNNAVNA